MLLEIEHVDFLPPTKSGKQNLGCFLLDLKAMYRIPIWGPILEITGKYSFENIFP
jgi:hypothetical protein